MMRVGGGGSCGWIGHHDGDHLYCVAHVYIIYMTLYNINRLLYKSFYDARVAATALLMFHQERKRRPIQDAMTMRRDEHLHILRQAAHGHLSITSRIPSS